MIIYYGNFNESSTSTATSGILINKVSDHLPCFILLEISLFNPPNPKRIKINTQNKKAIQNIINDISASDLYNKLDKSLTTDPNLSYNIIHEVIENVKNNHTLSKLVKFYKYKHKKSKWITMGLLKSITFRDKLYKRMKLTNPNSQQYEIMCINLKTYNTILKRSIRASKQHYFVSTFAKYKSDIRNTWKTINEMKLFQEKTTRNVFPNLSI